MTFIDEIERRGERKGQVRVLLQQLSARFGSVPPEVSARIQAAKRSMLDQWALRVLTANTPEEVVASKEASMTFIDEIERRGERKAQARILLQLINARFGSVPPEVSARIQAAKRSMLDQWALRVLTATTPEEVVASGEVKTAQVKPSRHQPATRKRTR